VVIPPALYYLFAPLLVVLVGVMAERIGSPKMRDGFSILASIWGVVSVWMLFNILQTSPDKILVITIGGNPPLAACLEIDALSIYVAFSAALLGFFANVYSYSYMDHDTRLTEYYTLLHALVVGIIGVALAGDLFTLFIFWETMGISSYALVSFRKDTPGPIEAGFKYMIMGSVGSTVLFFGAALLYGMTGTLNLAQMSSVIRGQAINPWLYLVFAMLIVGFGVKSAIVPMHTWLPDAHPEAPSPISAMLSGIVIETGLYAMIRVLFLLFEPSFFILPMAALAVITMTLGNLMALLQSDLKRLLAYSSIAQIGYMLIGVSAGTTYGIMGVFLHVFNHSLLKGMAFLSAGSIVHEANTRDIESLKGIGRFMPVTSLCLFITLLGLGGVPGTNGFISKFILFNSAIGEGMAWLAIVGVLNSALSMGYYLRVMKTLLSKPIESVKGLKEAPPMMLGVTVVMAVLIILLGLWPEPVISYASAAANALIDNLPKYIGRIMS
jgi:proton-translocating NADH-quinone oxidoreductase chain N